MTLTEKLYQFNPELELANAKTIPNTWYFDREIYEQELKTVFSKGWQFAARAEQLSEGGSFVTTTVGKLPVVLTRDKTGKLNAFANICRHKAAKIMVAACGKAPALQCRYHGWTYDLQGKLKGTPEFDGVAGFLKEENGLPSLQVALLGPLVFVNPDKSAPGLETEFAEFLVRAKPATLEKLKFVRRVEYTLKSNWKVFVDNYLDGGYHVNTLHPNLAGAIQYAQYKTETYARSSLQSTPLSSDSAVANVRKGEAQYWWLMPNFMVNLYDGVMDTNLVLPLDERNCRVIFDYYFADPQGETPSETEARLEKSMAVAHQVQLEDQEISESVQMGLESGSYHTGRFSVKRENALYAFHQLLARSLTQELN